MRNLEAKKKSSERLRFLLNDLSAKGVSNREVCRRMYPGLDGRLFDSQYQRLIKLKNGNSYYCMSIENAMKLLDVVKPEIEGFDAEWLCGYGGDFS